MNTGFSFDLGSTINTLGPLSRLKFDTSRYSTSPVSVASPTPPNMDELMEVYKGIPNAFSNRSLMKNMDKFIKGVEVAGSQQADNASREYASRLMQMGIVPTSSGVVKAKVQGGANRQVGELKSQQAAMEIENRKAAANTAASIAANIAGIRESYSRTLADYNKTSAMLNQQSNQFNASSALEGDKLQLAKAQASAELEMKLRALEMAEDKEGDKEMGGAGGSFYPGYIPNSGPIIPASINGIPQLGRVFGSWGEGLSVTPTGSFKR